MIITTRRNRSISFLPLHRINPMRYVRKKGKNRDLYRRLYNEHVENVSRMNTHGQHLRHLEEHIENPRNDRLLNKVKEVYHLIKLYNRYIDDARCSPMSFTYDSKEQKDVERQLEEKLPKLVKKLERRI